VRVSVLLILASLVLGCGTVRKVGRAEYVGAADLVRVSTGARLPVGPVTFDLTAGTSCDTVDWSPVPLLSARAGLRLEGSYLYAAIDYTTDGASVFLSLEVEY
jgi:hypothetical protein